MKDLDTIETDVVLSVEPMLWAQASLQFERKTRPSASSTTR